MNFLSRLLPVLVVAALALSGCKPKPRTISSLARKEAASLVSEAQFAVQLHDLARAEPLLLKAATLCPDTGGYFMSLGSIRRDLGKRDAAREAFESAVRAYAAAYKANAKEPDPLVDQFITLLVLGRPDAARPLLATARRDHPASGRVRELGTLTVEQIQRLPAIKSLAL